MKRKWLGLALAAAMACAGAATAAVYTDSSANYPEGWENGSNGGEGFMPWRIASNNGSGWAGGGIWETGKAEVSGDVVDANGNAFGIVGKGDGSSFTAIRNFRASLDVGDSFEFDMAVNWDCGDNPDSKKGIALLLDGTDAIVINNDPYPGPISVNGFTDDPALQTYGTGTMHWTILAKDATTVTVTGTARDGQSDPYSADITLSSSALTGFRLQSALQQNWEDGDTDEERQAKADKRQSYFNNFKLTIARDLPDIVTLEFTSGEWAVESASQTLAYTLTRSSSAGALDVAVSSSDEAFVAGTTVSFADGETSKDFTLAATLTGSGNFALITANAPGCDAVNSYEVKGPGFECTAEGGDAPWTLAPEETRTLKVKNTQPWGVHGDNSLVTVASQDEKIVTVSALGAWADDEASCTVTGIGGGWAPVEVFYAGVKMAEYGFTVVPSGATLSGPTSLRTGATATYTADITLGGFEEGTFRLVADPDDFVTIEPAEVVVTESGPIYFQVTAGNGTGPVTLTLEDDDGISGDASVTVEISKAPDYSSYVAYDDASFYSTGDLDYAATGVGIDGFQAWTDAYKNADGTTTYAGAVVVTSAADPSVLPDGKAFAVYANHSDDVGDSGEEIQLRREFVNPLDNGQAFSVVLSPNWRAGTKGVKFMGYDADVTHEWWQRAEFFYNEDGYFYKLEGDEEATLIWDDFSTDAITITLQKAADGSSYTLTFARGDEVVPKEGITSFGGTVNAVQFYSYQGGKDEEGNQNFVFNSLAIEQVEEPVPPAPPAVTMALSGVWNPDEVGVPYEFTLTPSEVGAIGLVDLSLEGEGAELSETQVDLTEGAATFTFTLTGDTLPAGAEFKITASAQDVDVEDATYGITVWEPSTMLVVVGGQYEFDYVAGGTVEFWLYGTPKFVGQQANLDSVNEAILAPPSPAVATVVPYYTESDEGKFAYTMVGTEEGQAWVHATKDEAEWGYAGITINGKAAEPGDVVPVKAISITNGVMTLTLDGKATAVYGATELNDETPPGWKWQALDLAIVGDGTSVTLPMDAEKMIFKVE